MLKDHEFQKCLVNNLDVWNDTILSYNNNFFQKRPHVLQWPQTAFFVNHLFISSLLLGWLSDLSNFSACWFSDKMIKKLLTYKWLINKIYYKNVQQWWPLLIFMTIGPSYRKANLHTMFFTVLMVKYKYSPAAQMRTMNN